MPVQRPLQYQQYHRGANAMFHWIIWRFLLNYKRLLISNNIARMPVSCFWHECDSIASMASWVCCFSSINVRDLSDGVKSHVLTGQHISNPRKIIFAFFFVGCPWNGIVLLIPHVGSVHHLPYFGCIDSTNPKSIPNCAPLAI